MSRHRFEAYLDKVFGFSDLVSALPEGRQFPQHSWKKVFDAVFLGAAMQIPSLLQIESECQAHPLQLADRNLHNLLILLAAIASSAKM